MKKLILPTLIVSLLTTPVAMAKHKQHNNTNWAKVTHVQPITKMIEVRTPHKQCWNETVRPVKRKQHHDPASTIIGTVIGGVIGNKVSHNKKVGTAVGAVVGATVGYELGRSDNHGSRKNKHTVSERHCVEEQRISYQEQIVGYHVWYRFHGNQYKTKMDQHPGKRIKVAVNVRPYS